MRNTIPFDMFELDFSEGERKRLAKVESLYHRGQLQAWDGKRVVKFLFEKHGVPRFTPQQRSALGNVVGQLMWGELAAWRTAAQLADELVPLETKMAATAQAHDEARHFYVFHDYLVQVQSPVPRALSTGAHRLIHSALASNSVAKKIVAMQLQVEATALTMFHSLREANLCPVLSELLVSIEKDEARHVGLGVQLLPLLLQRMSRLETAQLVLHSAAQVFYTIRSLQQAEPHLRVLGIDPRRVNQLGRSKQMLVFEQAFSGLSSGGDISARVAARALDVVSETLWPPPNEKVTFARHVKHVARTLKTGAERVAATLEPEVSPPAYPTAALA